MTQSNSQSPGISVAAIQHCANTDVQQNLQTLASLSRAAQQAGAQVIMWAEAFAYLGRHEGKKDILENLAQPGPILSFCQSLARELNVELLLGGFHEQHPVDSNRCFNTSVFLSQTGEIKATYRKIHLFDVNIDDGPNLQESKQTSGGEHTVVVDSLCGKLGLSICYDLRFPQLYQQLVDLGAIIISVPSAFTATTGAAHWHALLRARAIECQCYIVAPAQHGQHSKHRSSYGHSVIIDPWGEVIAEQAAGDGFIIASIDQQKVKDVRRQLPSLTNRRPFSPVKDTQ